MSLARACVVVVFAVGACSAAHPQARDAVAPTPDAGVDAGHDAGSDAGSEAGSDGGTDAFVADAFDPPDGSAWDPEWQRLVDAPADCNLAIATHPERLRWSDGFVTAAWAIEGTTYFDVTPPSSDPMRRLSYRGLADASGRVVTAFRQDAYCAIDELGVYGDEVGFHVTHCGTGSPCGLFGTWVAHVYGGRYDDLAATQRHVAQYALVLMNDIPPSPQIALGAALTAVVDLHAIVHVTRPDGTLVALSTSRETHPFFMGDELFYVSGDRVVRSIDGAPTTDLRDELGHTIRWLGTDGTTIAWTVGDTELYAGTYDGVLHGTLVRTGPGVRGDAVGAGYVARMTYGTGTPLHLALEVDRMTDGRRATVELPEYGGIGVTPILRVRADAVLLRAPGGHDVLSEMREIDPRTLTFH